MLKIRYLLILAAVAALVGVQQLAAHRQEAARLTDAVVAKDKAGQNGTNEQLALKAYTAKHMGTGRSVFMNGQYEGATLAAKLASNPQSNSQVYADAQAACGGQRDSITQARCVTDYVSSRSQPAANPQPITMPNREDEAFNPTFTSPRWTPDTTGLALLVATVLTLAAAVIALRRQHHKRSTTKHHSAS